MLAHITAKLKSANISYLQNSKKIVLSVLVQILDKEKI